MVRDSLQLAAGEVRLEVHHDITLGLLDRRLDDPPLRRLIERLLASGARLYADADCQRALGIHGRYVARPDKGLPIGNLTSQLFANAFLDGADHHVKRVLGIPFYLRYMDDLTLFDDDARRLERAVGRLLDWLVVERRLEARCRGAVAQRTTGCFTFLGYTIDRERRRLGSAMIRRVRARARAVALADGIDGDALEVQWRATLRGLLF